MTEGDEPGVVEQAALSGDRASLLDAIQARLARDLDAVVLERDAAVISRELRAVAAEREQLTGGEESQLDDLAARRAARRTGTTGP